MEASLGPLLALYQRERAAGKAMALGVLVHTAGSTYRKPGALILIAHDGEYSGLLSGGCLEGDLGEHARKVIDGGQARLVGYDMRGPEDLLWGLGIGCEGAMQILMLRVGPQDDWQPVDYLAKALQRRAHAAVGIITESADPRLPLGTLALPGMAGTPALHADPAVQELLARAAGSSQAGQLKTDTWTLFALPLTLPPRLLVLGAGPDAAPVVELAARMSWQVTVVDHRPAYADPTHFPWAEAVLQAPAGELAQHLDLTPFSAAVVMSHHLPSDLAHLAMLADSPIPYVGLLGPAARRDKLLSDLGARAQRLSDRLHAPVGLTIGGRTPEAIALSIVAQIHAFLHGIPAVPP